MSDVEQQEACGIEVLVYGCVETVSISESENASNSVAHHAPTGAHMHTTQSQTHTSKPTRTVTCMATSLIGWGTLCGGGLKQSWHRSGN